MSRSPGRLAQHSLARHAEVGREPRFPRSKYTTSREDFLWLERTDGRGQGGITAATPVGGMADVRVRGLQVVGDADGDLAGLEEQGGLNEEGGLVVQKVLPPVGRNEFREDHGQIAALALALHTIDVFQERAKDRSVG